MMKVYQAINAVQKSLSEVGISKDRTNTQGATYKFRGIDDVYNAVSPLLAKHGLCILPRMVSRQCVERVTKNGGAIFYVTVEAEFDFVSAEDGSKHTVRTFGEAMDTSDKATNKAMSAAYKYAAFQSFAIPTEGDNDADAHTHQITPSAGVEDNLSSVEKATLTDLAMEVENAFEYSGTDSAMRLIEENPVEDLISNKDAIAEGKIFLWKLLSSKTRSAIKKAKASNDSEKAAA